jgi:hypothetical protein
MPRPGHGAPVGDKAVNFKKSIGKLFSYCKGYVPLIVTALILAITGTIFSLSDRISFRISPILFRRASCRHPELIRIRLRILPYSL